MIVTKERPGHHPSLGLKDLLSYPVEPVSD